MAAPTQQEVTELLATVDETQKQVDFAETIVFDVDSTPVSGTRYRYILTNAPDPR